MSTTRRSFLALASIAPLMPAVARADEPPRVRTRAERLYETRMRAAQFVRDQATIESVPNGDERRYATKWGSYTKAMLHDANGYVERGVYDAYLRALDSGRHADLEQVPLGGYLKLADPQAALTFDLMGPDATHIPLRTPPAIASAEFASELAEMYWQALLRDVPFRDYESHPLAREAAAELSALSDFRAPKANGSVTAATLFRGPTAGGLRGPYVSQFLLRDIPMTPIRVPQKIRTAVPGRDYMVTAADWLAIQNGQLYSVNTFDSTQRYIRNGRDLGEYVHRDFTYQAGLCAALMLLKMSAPLDGAIPYQHSLTQGGFVTFGLSDILHLVVTVANLVMKAAWYHKWIVHRRVRPEEMGGYVGVAPLHRDFMDSGALALVKERTGTTFLPQAYPEGCPSHPAYPAGHAVIAGACSTILKACFAESWVLPEAFVASRDGLKLERYEGEPLTVGGELDKLAENISLGREFAGVHWRTDAIEGIRFGEDFAIRFLQEMKLTANDFFAGFGLTKFDGTRVTI